MTPRNLFKLAVRILGLVFLYHGLIMFPTMLCGPSGMPATIIMVIWPLGVVFCLLRFAPKITEFFYPKSED